MYTLLLFQSDQRVMEGSRRHKWILNQMEFHLVQNWKENCHHDHSPFNLKGNGILVFFLSLVSRIWYAVVVPARPTGNGGFKGTQMSIYSQRWLLYQLADILAATTNFWLQVGEGGSCGIVGKGVRDTLLFDDKVKMARKPGKKQKESPVGWTREVKTKR